MSKKNVIITGTSRGIGYELAKIFSNNGHTVLALSRNSAPIEDLNLDSVSALACDLNNPSDLQEVEKHISVNLQRVDILINNAGALINKPFVSTSTADFLEVYKTNVFAVAELIRIAHPFMKSDGHIVNISSMGGIQGSLKFPGLAAYSSSKGALITLSELLAEEFKENGPSVNVLALGAVQTEMLEEAFPGYNAPTSAAEMANYIYDFSMTGNQFYNGKILQVSNSTP
ncbi:Short-chain dehydrogenase [Flavobacteriaceae bacterium MAR_2010_188]|nr:Short-chain dehydrogenase [Flavobacteriaceae bacterium MAR_2010_188]